MTQMIRVKFGPMQSEIVPPQTKDVFVVRTIFTLKLYTPLPFFPILLPFTPTSSSAIQVPWNGSDFSVRAEHEL